jgi:hypothetical protein
VRPCGCVVGDDCAKCCCCCSAPVESPNPAPAPAACCQQEATEDCPLCREESPAPKSDEEPAPERDSLQIEWVNASLMQQCQGVQTCWIGIGAVVPPEDDVRVRADPSAYELVPFVSAIAEARSLGPNDPPPRSTSV